MPTDAENIRYAELHAHSRDQFPVEGCPSCRIAMSAVHGMQLILFVGIPVVAFQVYWIIRYAMLVLGD